MEEMAIAIPEAMPVEYLFAQEYLWHMSLPQLVSEPVHNALEVRLHQSETELEELRSFWIENEHHPNSGLNHFLLVCKSLPEVINPLVLSVWHVGRCRALLAGRLENASFHPSLGYLKLPGIKGRRIMFIHQGALGDLDSSIADTLVTRINGLLKERVADLVIFNQLPEGSPLLARVTAMPAQALGTAQPAWAQHWELQLQPEPGFLLKAMKSKHRSWHRRKERDLESVYKDRIKWHCFAQTEEVDVICRQMESVAVHTYQRGLGAGFRDDRLHRDRLSLFARQGALRIVMLEIDGRPAAFWLGTAFRGAFHSEATGYLPELRDHEIGTQMFIRLVDELVKEGINRFDFGFGDAHYKKRFGDRSWREATARLFSNRPRGIALRVYFGAFEAIERALRTIVKRLSVTDRFKQLWRKALVSGSKSASSKVPDSPSDDSQA